MTTMQRSLAVDQLDRKLRYFQDLPPELKVPPRSGWISSVRKALGMSGAVLAERLHVSQPAAAQFEKGERDRSLSLDTLHKIADALDAELVYAIVPRRSIREMLESKALQVAQERVLPLAHSMGLESQSTADSRLQEDVEYLAEQLINRPKDLWR